jgi:small-conductance mechanosensitive channel
MSEAIDKFCDGLNQQLTAIESRLLSVRDALRTAPGEAADTLQAKLEQARQKLEARQEEVQDLREKAAQWLTAKKAEAKATIDEWVASREKDRLEARATRAAEYAAAAVVLAAAAIDEAEVATLEAVQARLLAEAASE